MKLAGLAGAGVLAVTVLASAQGSVPASSPGSSGPRTQSQERPDSVLVALSTQDDTCIKHEGGKSDIDAAGNRNVCNLGNAYTLERQVGIGRSVAQQIESRVKFVNDPVISEYMNRIGQNLARNSNAPVPLTVKVLDSNAVNALSLPGGFLYVNAGLILAADEEAELAGAMAHEIAHIAACHAGRQWSSSEGKPMWDPIIPESGGIDDAAGMSGIARFTRGFEAEADYLGIQYMYSAGYDPSALVSYFEKIDAMEKPPWKPGAVGRAFVTHPQNPDRVERSKKEIRSLLPSKPEYLVTSSEFDEVKARLAAIDDSAPK